MLAKLESHVSYGAVENIVKLTRSSLRLNGLSFNKDYDYNLLLSRLRKCYGVKQAYTDDEVRSLLQAAEGAGDRCQLLRLCILMAYSGLRVSAGRGVKFSDFKRVEPFDVFIYPVHSKGYSYIAAISAYAHDCLIKANLDNDEEVAPYNPELKSPFDIIYRNRLGNAIKNSNIRLQSPNSTIMHSFRRYFAQKVAEANLRQEAAGFLLGHKPDTTAYKYYIDSNRLEKPIAEAYSQTSLVTLRLI